MSDYVIYTDSSCDIAPAILAEWGVHSCSLSFSFDGGATALTEAEMPVAEFYQKMRQGEVAKTSAVNVSTFTAAFEKEAAAGRDVLYLGFSSGLSATYNSGRVAMEELSERYPERTLLSVDSLCASAGQGLLLYLATEKKKQGMDIRSLAEYLADIRLNICHWFTVDDLVYLKRGGRIGATAAFVGNVLGIKPILHVDDEGHLINMFKVRGRRTAVTALADKLGETALDPKGGTVYISHADCMADAELLSSILRDKYGAIVDIIADVGPVIGAHSGPGTLALFFLGKER